MARSEDPGPVFTGGQRVRRTVAPRPGIPHANDTLDEEAIRAVRQEAGPHAPYDPERDPCDQAWESYARENQARAKVRNEAPSGTSRERFLTTCNRLPEEFRPCMVPSFAAADPNECARRSVAVGGRENPRSPPPGLEDLQREFERQEAGEGREQ